MFRLFTGIFMTLMSIVFPPLFVITLPLLIFFGASRFLRKNEEQRVLSIYEAHVDREARIKALRAFS